MPDDEFPMTTFGFRHSTFFRHSSFELPHSEYAEALLEPCNHVCLALGRWRRECGGFDGEVLRGRVQCCQRVAFECGVLGDSGAGWLFVAGDVGRVGAVRWV